VYFDFVIILFISLVFYMTLVCKTMPKSQDALFRSCLPSSLVGHMLNFFENNYESNINYSKPNQFGYCLN